MKKVASYRFSESALNHLDYICDVSHVTKSQFLEGCIEAQYNSLTNNADLMKLINQMNDLRQSLSGLSDTDQK